MDSIFSVFARKTFLEKQRARNSFEMAGRFGAMVSMLALFSLAFPIMYILNEANDMKDPLKLFIVGGGICFVFFLASKYVLKNVICGMLCFFGFTTVIDQVLALTAAKKIEMGNFYLLFGEPYLATSHGCLACLHDGIVHFLLYLYLGVCHSQKDVISFTWYQRYAGLFWFGSMMNSLHVLFPGVFSGIMGAQTELSILFNVPFFFFPLWYGIKTFAASPPFKLPQIKQNFLFRLLDFISVGWFLFISLFSFVRLFAALGSPYPPAVWWVREVEPILSNPQKFPALQMIVYVFWGTPLSGILASAHWNAATNGNIPKWIGDVASILAGAVVQGQSCFLGAAMLNDVMVETPNFVPIPKQYETLFWTLNLLIVAVPMYSFLRFCLFTEEKKKKK